MTKEQMKMCECESDSAASDSSMQRSCESGTEALRLVWYFLYRFLPMLILSFFVLALEISGKEVEMEKENMLLFIMMVVTVSWSIYSRRYPIP